MQASELAELSQLTYAKKRMHTVCWDHAALVVDVWQVSVKPEAEAFIARETDTASRNCSVQSHVRTICLMCCKVPLHGFPSCSSSQNSDIPLRANT